MAKFTIKVLFLLCTFMFGILLGIHQAELGILAIEGIPQDEEAQKEEEAEDEADEKDAETEQSETDGEGQEEYEETYITKIDGEEVEVAIVGEAIDLEEKEEEWQERAYTGNRYSALGNSIGDVIYSVSRSGADWFVSQLKKIL